MRIQSANIKDNVLAPTIKAPDKGGGWVWVHSIAKNGMHDHLEVILGKYVQSLRLRKDVDYRQERVGPT